ncbi:MAG: universal stress protein [Bacillota bacterium]
MFTKIMVAFDGSPPSFEALRAALDLAEKYHSALVCVSVVHLPEYAGTLDEVDENIQRARQYYEKPLQQAAFLATEKGVELKSEVLYGHAGERLVEYAFREGIDLIVTGARGLSGLRRYLLGSVSNYLVNNATCPVLVIRGKAPAGK